MKKCNARPGPVQPYFNENINVLGSIEESVRVEDKEGDGPLLMRGMEPENYRKLVQKVEQFRRKFGLADIPDQGRFEALEKISDTQKELLQKNNLCSLIMEECEDLPSFLKVAVIEMGCGKAGLTHHLVSQNAERLAGSHIYLVDRDNFKGKMDSHAAELGLQLKDKIHVNRVKIDIKDLDIDKMIREDIETVVVISKHLCGAATCLTLAALRHVVQQRPNMYFAFPLTKLMIQIDKSR
jgi:tRNA:m4X modification enzyme